MKQYKPLNNVQCEMVEAAIPLAKWTVRKYIISNERIVGLSHDDLLQEAYVALCKAAATYQDGETQFKTYAVTVMHNHLIDYCRQINTERRNIPCSSLDEPTDHGSDEENMVRQLLSEEGEFEHKIISKSWIDTFLKERKAAYQGCARLGIEALELKVLYGYGVTDIAQLYEVKPNLVGAWISKAKAKIKNDLTEAERENALG